ncbi:alkylhydroperoxidase AhpD family core domain-containing protein [Lentzea albidocapillata subsp. violacea]|uniref:Alkylhydroperoxidase AhpD family core domain-containing protein n=1 Tax=Lentzea albidocapillata subsp. violacea TaxID=128104 RepID=A0A1H0AFB7_9PSEU|nr:carboxymuconolactone decarboxylase family protein [Lentzea albidocapillata]SDN31486.1 alkylhydroperoxidase AhpD family core domain-containing protein [Lentzea albidocapillata subsp. violacea]
MRRIPALVPAAAPDKSRELLTEIITRRGSVGDMVSSMAHSPALLQGYLDFSRALKRVKLPRALSEKISLAAQEWIGCGTCLAAHTEAARANGVSDSDIVLARQGTAVDPREAALIAFAVRVLAEPSGISDDDLAGLRAHGWSDRVIADVVGVVALNLLTGAFNLVAGIEPSITRP